ncbi:hypothetical protein Droror1_Dr00018607 [Drosera rotundifolia]
MRLTYILIGCYHYVAHESHPVELNLLSFYTLQEFALLTDGRFSSGSHGFVIGHICPEAQVMAHLLRAVHKSIQGGIFPSALLSYKEALKFVKYWKRTYPALYRSNSLFV